MSFIKLAATDQELSSNGGLVLLERLSGKLNIDRRVSSHLPTLVSGIGRSLKKFTDLMHGFMAGAECLDDMDRLAKDQGFRAVCDDNTYTAKAHGNFLRSFTPAQTKGLNTSLATLAYDMRAQLFGDGESITFDFDSTDNEQYGKKMEGVERIYKGYLALSTMQVFDERGLQYWNDVRPGATHTAHDVADIVHNVLNQMPKSAYYKRQRRYARADAGYSNHSFFNACIAKHVGFVVRLHENMLTPQLPKILTWKVQNPNKENRIMFYEGNREAEIGEMYYRPENCAENLRVVCLRAVKKDREAVLFKQEQDYDYFAFISNIGAHEKSAEALVKFYRKRGNAENYIRELKYGLDLKHYPCLKLNANKAYGLIAAFAHNLMRFLSLKECASRPQFSKAIRFRFIHLPVQVVRHAGEVTFRFMRRHYEEVKRIADMIANIQFGSA